VFGVYNSACEYSGLWAGVSGSGSGFEDLRFNDLEFV